MRPFRKVVLAIVFWGTALVGASNKMRAAIVLSFQSGASFVEGSGVQSMDILARSNADDQAISIVAE